MTTGASSRWRGAPTSRCCGTSRTTTGGRFFEAVDEAALGQIFAEIDELERVELEDPLYRADERFLPFLLSGAGLLLLALFLRTTVLVTGP